MTRRERLSLISVLWDTVALGYLFGVFGWRIALAVVFCGAAMNARRFYEREKGRDGS